MIKRVILLCIIFLLFISESKAQNSDKITIELVKTDYNILPETITNIPFFVYNAGADTVEVIPKINVPEGLKLIPTLFKSKVKPNEKKFFVGSIRASQFCAVGEYTVAIELFGSVQNLFDTKEISIKVDETENIQVQLIESPEYVFAGETMHALYRIQNLGNTEKNIVYETYNCSIDGSSSVNLAPGEMVNVEVKKQFADDYLEVSKEFFSLKTIVSNEVTNSIFRPVLIFPSGNSAKEQYHRFPISFSSTYISTNYRGTLQDAYQFELFGSGTLDVAGKHSLEFLARGPNNADLSFLGLYDQYYLSYNHDNFEFSIGEKSYSFTPLTESSRFGFGVESKVKFNFGLSFGYTYVKPRFFDLIDNESAIFTEFKKDRNNIFSFYFIQKKEKFTLEPTELYSLNTKFSVVKNTILDLEFSRGRYKNIWDNAFRVNVDANVSIFNLSGNYFITGKHYPGYYSNSKFYSGNISAQISSNIGVGLNLREDFTNAQLDTLFVVAPYSKSFQSFLNYRINDISNFKFYYRKSERKDRLATDKFHFQINSLNAQYIRKLKKMEYQLLGEVGKTTNFLAGLEKNKQNAFRGTASLMYKLNAQNAFRVFSSWSNINSFITNSQRHVTAGISVFSQINENLKVDFHLQNAFDVEDYYRNRNLMQLHLNYKFLKKHSISLRSYYTLFRQKEKDPDFTLAATYSYKFGIPVKKLMKSGAVKGKILTQNNEPADGIILNIQGKSAVTNRKGEYFFRAITPGKQLLTIDKSKLNIDEITSIPLPYEIEVIENKEVDINFKIVKGAKVEGVFTLKDKNVNNENINLGNIVVELKSEFQNFRITTNEKGNFSFPLVIPGEWLLKIYDNSIPGGFEMENNNFRLVLSQGEQKTIPIQLKEKERKIIFKNQNFTFNSNGTLEGKSISFSNPNKKTKIQPTQTSTFYSVQVGAFKSKIDAKSKYFSQMAFDFDLEFDKLNKYFIGKFETYEQAKEKQKELNEIFKGAFVVFIDNNEVIQLINKKR